MTIQEIMERSGSRRTGDIIAYIRDAINIIQSNTEDKITTEKQNIISGIRDYRLPADMIALKSISVLDTEDDNKYKRIPRLSGTPILMEDTAP